MFATRSAHEIADEAVQIFGGRALTQTGMGKTIEMFHRYVRASGDLKPNLYFDTSWKATSHIKMLLTLF